MGGLGEEAAELAVTVGADVEVTVFLLEVDAESEARVEFKLLVLFLRFPLYSQSNGTSMSAYFNLELIVKLDSSRCKSIHIQRQKRKKKREGTQSNIK